MRKFLSAVAVAALAIAGFPPAAGAEETQAPLTEVQALVGQPRLGNPWK